MSSEQTAELAAHFMDAANFFGAIISPEALAIMRGLQSDQELRAALEEATRTCLKVVTRITSVPDGMDLAKLKELLTPLLESPELIDFQKPAALTERLRAALAAMGIPTEAGGPGAASPSR